MDEAIKLLKQAREAILECQNRVDFRSPAGRDVKAALEAIDRYLAEVKDVE